MPFRVKRVYERRTRGDGMRVLLDRIWPRGLSKEAADVDLWLKEAAPSTELRKWFGHAPERWNEFRARYFAELAAHHDVLAPLARRAKRQNVTLLFGAKEQRFNNAVALCAYFEAHPQLGSRTEEPTC